jgi:hypothetical protein
VKPGTGYLTPYHKARWWAVNPRNPKTRLTGEPQSERRPTMAKKDKAPEWKTFSRAKKRDWLLSHPTIPDAAHTAEKREKGESRSDFIRRIYGSPARELVAV